jgi:hypothetical protein
VSLVIVELRAANASKRDQEARWIFYQKTLTHYQWTTEKIKEKKTNEN